MRRSLSLLLAASVVLSSVLFISGSGSAPASVPAPVSTSVPGPHWQLPEPGVYDHIPFQQNPPLLGSTGRTRGPLTTDVLVLLLEFTDRTHDAAHSAGYVSTLMNGNSPGNLRHYYNEVSYGSYLLTATIGRNQWFQSAYRMDRYGSDSVSGKDDANGPIYELVREVVLLADAAGVNFANYDLDSDGVVDHLFIVHAGAGQESSGTNNDIWSHRWAVVSPVLRVDGVQVYGYTMVSESSPIGVIAHEFGHDLGLPDLYNTATGGPGAGIWDLMATGSWAGPVTAKGSSPAHIGAWGKIKLGWIVPTEITAPRYRLDIPDVEGNPAAFKLPIKDSGGGEYFLVENREKTGYDSYMPGEGLLIWHIDESVANNDNDAHRKVSLMEADDPSGMSPTDSGDPWANSAAGFTPDSSPNSNGYGNIRTGWKVRNIGQAGNVMTADISQEVDDDMAIVQVLNTRSVAVNSAVAVTVEVANLGARNQTGVPISLAVYRGNHSAESRVFNATRTYTVPAKTYVNFTWYYVPRSQGRYLVDVDALLANDEIPENNRRLTHFNAMTWYFFDDVEAGIKGWTASPAGELHQWQIVQLGDATGDASSPNHSWRFGYFGGIGSTSSLYTLESGDISFQSGPLYLSFFNRYQLAVQSDSPGNNSDVAFVKISFNGQPWQLAPGGRLEGTQTQWTLFYADLSSHSAAPGIMRIRFESTTGRMPDSGGWWIDDVFVSTFALSRGVSILPVNTAQTVEPGGKASFIFKVVNIGDFNDTFSFVVSSEVGWVVMLNSEGISQYPEAVRLSILPDREKIATLIVQTPGDASRGTEVTFTVTTRSVVSSSVRDSFSAVVTIHDPLGLSRLARYILLFIVVFIVLVAIAMIIDHIKRRRGIR